MTSFVEIAERGSAYCSPSENKVLRSNKNPFKLKQVIKKLKTIVNTDGRKEDGKKFFTVKEKSGAERFIGTFKNLFKDVKTKDETKKTQTKDEGNLKTKHVQLHANLDAAEREVPVSNIESPKKVNHQPSSRCDFFDHVLREEHFMPVEIDPFETIIFPPITQDEESIRDITNDQSSLDKNQTREPDQVKKETSHKFVLQNSFTNQFLKKGDLIAKKAKNLRKMAKRTGNMTLDTVKNFMRGPKNKTKQKLCKAEFQKDNSARNATEGPFFNTHEEKIFNGVCNKEERTGIMAPSTVVNSMQDPQNQTTQDLCKAEFQKDNSAGGRQKGNFSEGSFFNTTKEKIFSGVCNKVNSASESVRNFLFRRAQKKIKNRRQRFGDNNLTVLPSPLGNKYIESPYEVDTKIPVRSYPSVVFDKGKPPPGNGNCEANELHGGSECSDIVADIKNHLGGEMVNQKKSMIEGDPRSGFQSDSEEKVYENIGAIYESEEGDFSMSSYEDSDSEEGVQQRGKRSPRENGLLGSLQLKGKSNCCKSLNDKNFAGRHQEFFKSEEKNFPSMASFEGRSGETKNVSGGIDDVDHHTNHKQLKSKLNELDENIEKDEQGMNSAPQEFVKKTHKQRPRASSFKFEKHEKPKMSVEETVKLLKKLSRQFVKGDEESSKHDRSERNSGEERPCDFDCDFNDKVNTKEMVIGCKRVIVNKYFNFTIQPGKTGTRDMAGDIIRNIKQIASCF